MVGPCSIDVYVYQCSFQPQTLKVILVHGIRCGTATSFHIWHPIKEMRQFTLISGLWSGEMSYRYVAAMRTVAGNAALDFVETTDAASIFDAVIRREFRSGFQGYLGVNNLFDAVVVVAKRPAGLRPAMPRLFRMQRGRSKFHVAFSGQPSFRDQLQFAGKFDLPPKISLQHVSGGKESSPESAKRNIFGDAVAAADKLKLMWSLIPNN